MDAIQLDFIPSTKYSTKGELVFTSHPTEDDVGYLWSKGGGRVIIKEGKELVRLVCSGCRSIKDKQEEWPAGAKLGHVKANWTEHHQGSITRVGRRATDGGSKNSSVLLNEGRSLSAADVVVVTAPAR
jgi:hypothetical protein